LPGTGWWNRILIMPLIVGACINRKTVKEDLKMRSIIKNLVFLGLFIMSCTGFSQDDSDPRKVQDTLLKTSNIQQYTPSKLIGKGQWDLK
jgi:hypothetical protein